MCARFSYAIRVATNIAFLLNVQTPSPQFEAPPPPPTRLELERSVTKTAE
jgi:hypothetical protein